LDVEKGAVRVHLAGKHPFEFEPFDHRGKRVGVPFDLADGSRIGLFGCQFEQFAGVAQTACQPVEVADDAFEIGALPPQFLRALGVVPDSGLLELASYLLEALVLGIVIKDTSSGSPCGPRDL
jgi:hypothetical protein